MRRSPAISKARITEVGPGSPAERAGLRKGDVILKADDVPIRSATQMRNVIGLTPVGHEVHLTIERDRATENATVQVEPLSEPRARASGRG